MLRSEGLGRAGPDRRHLLNMNFSVGVSMYKLNVTSYWYRLRCSQFKNGAGLTNIAGMSRTVRTVRMVAVVLKKGAGSLVIVDWDILYNAERPLYMGLGCRLWLR